MQPTALAPNALHAVACIQLTHGAFYVHDWQLYNVPTPTTQDTDSGMPNMVLGLGPNFSITV